MLRVGGRLRARARRKKRRRGRGTGRQVTAQTRLILPTFAGVSVAVRTLDGMEGDELHRSPSDEETGRDSRESGSDAWQRLSAYAYLSAPERLEYVAVMRVFCGTLLADLAAPDVLAK